MATPDKAQGRRHITPTELDWRELGNGWSAARVELADGESAWAPVGAGNVVAGKATVTYTRAPSGSIGVEVAR